MRTNQSKLKYGLVAACFVVSLAAVACGDDSDGGEAGAGGAGSGGAGGGTAGTGTGGTGGAKAGTGGGGGAAPSIPECTMKTVAKLGAQGMACATCVCTKNTKLATDCANTSQCWNLIRCAGANNCAPGGMTDVSCLTSKCADFIMDTPSNNAATPFGSPVVRMMCGMECPSMPAGDGGTDAGI